MTDPQTTPRIVTCPDCGNHHICSARDIESLFAEVRGALDFAKMRSVKLDDVYDFDAALQSLEAIYARI